MAFQVVTCPRCSGTYQSDEHRCPFCATISPQGRRNRLLSMLASLTFVVAVASVTFMIVRFRKADADAARSGRLLPAEPAMPGSSMAGTRQP